MDSIICLLSFPHLLYSLIVYTQAQVSDTGDSKEQRSKSSNLTGDKKEEDWPSSSILWLSLGLTASTHGVTPSSIWSRPSSMDTILFSLYFSIVSFLLWFSRNSTSRTPALTCRRCAWGEDGDAVDTEADGASRQDPTAVYFFSTIFNPFRMRNALAALPEAKQNKTKWVK